jgi:spore maturation protein SpmA
MNWIFLGLIATSVLAGALSGNMKLVSDASISSAKTAVDLSLSLIGQMTLWLGLVGILREAGFLKTMGRGLRPLLRVLFPTIPEDHPALGAMVMNMAANLLGLGNAATPFGLKAMRELDTLNDKKGVATDAMVLFLGINSAGLALIPISTIALRAAMGSTNAASILIPTLLATFCSTLCVIAAARWLAARKHFSRESLVGADEHVSGTNIQVSPSNAALAQAESLAAIEPIRYPWREFAVAAGFLFILFAGLQSIRLAEIPAPQGLRQVIEAWTLPVLIFAFVSAGFARGVNLYATFGSAAKEGFQTAIGVIPFLVGMLVSIGMFRASGALDLLIHALSPLVAPLGFPAEALPMVLIRPLSGSGATGVMTDIMKIHGPDSFLGQLVSVLNGSTETTFYVIALYFGSINIKHMRHAIFTCLVADVVGPLVAFLACKAFFS